MRCHFIPQYLLDTLAGAPDTEAAARGRRTMAIDAEVRAQVVAPAVATGAAWEIHDAHNGSELPGELVRTAGEPEVGDVTVDEAATGITESLALFADFGRSSYDDKGATVVATVHYEQDYDNAFWDGNQLVFGDGDGRVFDRFTKPIDVLGHELSHAVTQFTADLTYQGQSGAMNESISDVFGACIKQRSLGQDAAAADWLVGEGIFLPGINGRALRSMSDPGTAYDDPQIGKDPQVGSMADFVETTDDNGGVHLNSGIPNRAFVLAARAIGGDSWSGAGRIWYAALTSGIPADSDFATFAAATVAAAGANAGAVEDAWTTVGVTPGSLVRHLQRHDGRGDLGGGPAFRRLRRAHQGRRRRPQLRRPARARGALAGRPDRLHRRGTRPAPAGQVRLPLPLRHRRVPGAGAGADPRPPPARGDRAGGVAPEGGSSGLGACAGPLG